MPPPNSWPRRTERAATIAGDDVYSASSAAIWSPFSLNSPGRPVEARPIDAPMLNGAPDLDFGGARLPRARMESASIAPPCAAVRSVGSSFVARVARYLSVRRLAPSAQCSLVYTIISAPSRSSTNSPEKLTPHIRSTLFGSSSTRPNRQ